MDNYERYAFLIRSLYKESRLSILPDYPSHTNHAILCLFCQGELLDIPGFLCYSACV
jgi:hypothetical protein